MRLDVVVLLRISLIIRTFLYSTIHNRSAAQCPLTVFEPHLNHILYTLLLSFIFYIEIKVCG